MAVQITVRIPDDAAEHLDQAVTSGRAASRAELIAHLLQKDLQRQEALADLEKLRAAGALPTAYPDLEQVAQATSSRPLDLA